MRECATCGGGIPPGKKATARFCSDRCRKKADEQKPGGACKCGATLSRQSVRGGATRCLACYHAEQRAERERALALVAEMWNQGRTCREISVALGRGDHNSGASPELALLRAAGRIGYRYPVERHRTGHLSAARWAA